MRFFFLSLALLCTTNVWAAISVTGISGASSSTLTGTPTMFGALGGSDCGADVASSVTSTCDSCRTATVPASCTTAPLCVCSSNRIHSALHAHIALKKDTADVGEAKASLVLSGATGGTVLTTPPNGGNSVDFSWAQVCAVLDPSNPNCNAATASSTGSLTGTLTIWLTATNTSTPGTSEPQTTVSVRLINPGASEAVFGVTGTDGIGSFSPYPGDEKVFIEDTKAGSGFPNLAGGGIATSVRVFISDKTLDDAFPKGANQFTPADLPVDSTTNELIEHTVKDLTNGTRYYFRIAIVDNAGNVTQYYPPYAAPFGTECTTAAATNVDCAFSAVPDQVLGLLTKDVNCFIATAAYGSAMEPKLQTFRDFRYKILLRHEWGVSFVRWYYNYGPKAAQFIYDKPVLRAMARGLLWPVFGFTWVSLRLGLLPTALLFLMLLTSMTIPLWLSFRRSTTRV